MLTKLPDAPVSAADYEIFKSLFNPSAKSKQKACEKCSRVVATTKKLVENLRAENEALKAKLSGHNKSTQALDLLSRDLSQAGAEMERAVADASCLLAEQKEELVRVNDGNLPFERVKALLLTQRDELQDSLKNKDLEIEALKRQIAELKAENELETDGWSVVDSVQPAF